MYQAKDKPTLKKRNFDFFFFLVSVFTDFITNVRKNVIAFCKQAGIKIHGALAITATTPLLNLNLNYEKLRYKYSEYYLFSNIHNPNFSIFKYQNLLPMLIKAYFCLQVSWIS